MENGDRAFYWDNDNVFPDSLTEEPYCGGFWLCVSVKPLGVKAHTGSVRSAYLKNLLKVIYSPGFPLQNKGTGVIQVR